MARTAAASRVTPAQAPVGPTGDTAVTGSTSLTVADLAAIVAAATLALSVRHSAAHNVWIVLAGLCLLTGAMALRSAGGIASRRARGRAALALALALMLVNVAVGLIAPPVRSPATGVAEVWRAMTLAWLALGAVCAVVAPWRRARRSRWLAYGLTAGAMTVTAVAGARLMALQARGLVDVHTLHVRAAEALAAGRSPFVGLGVDDGSPFAPPAAVIDGYPYPPVALAWYATSYLVTGDPRWASVVAWLATLALAAVLLLRRLPGNALAAAALMLVLASQPGWLLVIQYSWTEPASVLLAALALALWHRSVASSTATGLLLASKQYFVVTAPALLLARVARRRRWLATLAVTTALAVAVGLLGGPGAFVRANVLFHLDRHVRPDSSNLLALLAAQGVDWAPPAWLALAAPLAVAAAVARWVLGPARLMLAVAATLAVAFLLGSQAFANYWFLVSSLVFLAATAPPGTGESVDAVAPPAGAAAGPRDATAPSHAV